MSEQHTFAQRSQRKVYFNHADLDYYLMWVMGREVYEGSKASECMAAAQDMNAHTVSEWQRAWLDLAQSLEAQANQSNTPAPNATLRGLYLRACSYYRAALFLMPPSHAQFQSSIANMQACFARALPHFEFPIAPIQVAHQGHTYHGYLWKPDNAAPKRPLLIVIGGIETFAEDCYFMLGHSPLAYGYNVLTIDLPGQGVNPLADAYFEARLQRSVSAMLDVILARDDIDTERVAVYGFSWGGHVVCKAAQHDKRIKAVIANPAMPDVFRAALAQQKGVNRRDPISQSVFKQVAWRMGLKISLNPADIGRRFVKAYDYLMHGKADISQITCPMLCLAGEGEPEITRKIAHEIYAKLPHPAKKLAIFTAAQNGEAHCQINNLALPNQTMLTWLNELWRTE